MPTTLTPPAALAHFVSGRWLPGGQERRTTLVAPATELPYGDAPVASPADLDAAFAAAAGALSVWAGATPATRSLALLRIADSLEDRAEELVAAEAIATGKPRRQVRDDELPPVLDEIRFFAGAARHLDGLAAGEYMARTTSYVRREPVGVVAQVTPWNYPIMMAVWKWAPALAAGCTVVLKPAETTPWTPLLLAEIAAEHLPPGVLNVVCGDRATGAAMVTHPVPAMVSLTGSVRAGREVAASAGGALKRLHLELGGKAPVVVLDDADVPTTAAGIVYAGTYNAGQSCTAATRVLATPRVHDALVTALAEAAGAVRVGGPDDDDAAYGALNNADQMGRVSGLVDRRGAASEVVAGGSRLQREGLFFAPTVIAGVREEDEISREEVFGPVVTVQRVDGEEAAVLSANNGEHGLAASVWTTDHARAMRLSAALDAGAVWVNTHSALASEMPHGGFKASGWGSDLSVYSLQDYTRLKHVAHRW